MKIQHLKNIASGLAFASFAAIIIMLSAGFIYWDIAKVNPAIWGNDSRFFFILVVFLAFAGGVIEGSANAKNTK